MDDATAHLNSSDGPGLVEPVECGETAAFGPVEPGRSLVRWCGARETADPLALASAMAADLEAAVEGVAVADPTCAAAGESVAICTVNFQLEPGERIAFRLVFVVPSAADWSDEPADSAGVAVYVEFALLAPL